MVCLKSYLKELKNEIKDKKRKNNQKDFELKNNEGFYKITRIRLTLYFVFSLMKLIFFTHLSTSYIAKFANNAYEI